MLSIAIMRQAKQSDTSTLQSPLASFLMWQAKQSDTSTLQSPHAGFNSTHENCPSRDGSFLLGSSFFFWSSSYHWDIRLKDTFTRRNKSNSQGKGRWLDSENLPSWNTTNNQSLPREEKRNSDCSPTREFFFFFFFFFLLSPDNNHVLSSSLKRE